MGRPCRPDLRPRGSAWGSTREGGGDSLESLAVVVGGREDDELGPRNVRHSVVDDVHERKHGEEEGDENDATSRDVGCNMQHQSLRDGREG
jgi:hypothetical protein